MNKPTSLDRAYDRKPPHNEKRSVISIKPAWWYGVHKPGTLYKNVDTQNQTRTCK